MITIAFYSYKGGVGRTLALANLGTYLTQLGARVVMIDFDLEAPGLPYKFADTPRLVRQGRGGLTRILADLSRGNAFNKDQLQSSIIEVKPSSPAADDAPDGDKNGQRLGEGKLWLLPAGDHTESTYWNDLAAIDWRRLFNSAGSLGVNSMYQVKRAIEDTYHPDFLLIDSRTGITASGGVATTLLADVVVTMLINNREHEDGTRLVVNSLLATNDSEHSPRVVPVLSRFSKSPSLEAVVDGLAESKADETDVADQLGLMLRAGLPESIHSSLSPTFILHTDSRLQRRERLLFSSTGEVMSESSATLQNDYLRLFSALVPRETMAPYVEPVRRRARTQFMEEPEEAIAMLRDLASVVASVDVLQDLAKMHIVRRNNGELLRTVERLYDVHRVILARDEITEAMSDAIEDYGGYHAVEMEFEPTAEFVEAYWKRLYAPSPDFTVSMASYLVAKGFLDRGVGYVLEVCNLNDQAREEIAATSIALLARGGKLQEQASAMVAEAIITPSSSLPLLRSAVQAVRFADDRDLALRLETCRDFNRMPSMERIYVHQVADHHDLARELALESLLAMDRTALQRESEALRYWQILRADSRMVTQLRETRYEAYEIVSRRTMDEDRYMFG